MIDLDEAILHCEKKSKELREQPFKEKMDIEDIADCEECAEEHEQLAEWLTQLKRIKEAFKTGEVMNLVAECMSIWGE